MSKRLQPHTLQPYVLQVELLRTALGAAGGAQEALRSQHAHREVGLLGRNDALQAQLRELNAQVERVLQREIKRHRPGAAAAAASPAVKAKSAPPNSLPHSLLTKQSKPRAPRIAAQTKGGPPAAFFDAHA